MIQIIPELIESSNTVCYILQLKTHDYLLLKQHYKFRCIRRCLCSSLI